MYSNHNVNGFFYTAQSIAIYMVYTGMLKTNLKCDSSTTCVSNPKRPGELLVRDPCFNI